MSAGYTQLVGAWRSGADLEQVDAITVQGPCPICGEEGRLIDATDELTTAWCAGPCDPRAIIAILAGRGSANGHEPASENGAGPQEKAANLRRLDIAKMLREAPPAVPWLVEPLIAVGYLTMLFGSPGEGKSMLAAALSAGIAHGEDLAGFGCRQGRVVYVDAENGEREIHRRVRSLGLPADGVALYEPEKFDLRRRGIEQLEHVATVERANLLILDSLRTLAPGLDENDPAQISAALDPLRDLAHRAELAVLVVHHANKGGRDYRGSSAILASVELAFRFARADEDTDRERRFLAPWKFRLGPEPERRWLALTAERGMVLVRAAEPFDGEESAKPKSTKAATLGPEILHVLEQAALPLADVARAVGEGPKSGTVRRALDLLIEDGDVERLDDGTYRGCQGARGTRGDGTLAPSEDCHLRVVDPQDDLFDGEDES